MSGSILNANILYASGTSSTQADSSLIGATALSGLYSYGSAATPTTYTVNTALSVTAGAVFDAGSYSTLDLTAALSASILVTFDIGGPCTVPGGPSVPAGHGTLEFGGSAVAVYALDTINFFGGSNELIIDSGTSAPAAVSGFGATDTIDFKGSTFVTGEYYSNGIAGLGAGIYTNTGIAGAPVRRLALDLSGLGTSDVKVVSDGSGGTMIEFVCFLRGTSIATPDGETAVESLQAGDLVATQRSGAIAYQAVKWIGRRRIDLRAHPHPERAAPIRIRRGAFADTVPHADLLVSPDHAIFVDGVLICARQLLNGATIVQDRTLAEVEYFHVELERHSILLAEGLATESYLDTGNRGFFANAGGALVLHPDLTDATDYPERETASCAPFVWDEASVRPVWQRLADRAAAVGRAVTTPETTVDPDLHLVADGRTLRPVAAGHGRYRFVLPAGATEVRIVSRSASPTDAQPWMEDRRRLGAYVERVAIHADQDVTVVPLDRPDLTDGWWDLERNGHAMRRWTDGSARLTLPARDGVAMLEVRLAQSALLYLLAQEAAAYRRAA